MSLQAPPWRFLVNSPASSPATVTVAGGVISIAGMQGLQPFEVDSVEYCSRLCTTPCTKNIWTVTPTVPTAPCECPWTWTLYLVMAQCQGMRTDRIFGRNLSYSYTDPSGSVPTVSAICSAIAADINADPYKQFTATLTGSGPSSYTAIVITENDCDGRDATCGFRAAVTMGTAVNTTPAVAAELNFTAMKRLWAEKPGYFFGVQEAPLEGANYCVYKFRVNTAKTNDPHLANATVDRYMDLEFYVRNDGTANFTTGWDTPLTAELPCLGTAL